MTTGESPKAQPNTSPPMSEAVFVDELTSLIKRGNDAGLNALNITIRVCFRRGVSMLDAMLANIEKDTLSGIGKKG